MLWGKGLEGKAGWDGGLEGPEGPVPHRRTHLSGAEEPGGSSRHPLGWTAVSVAEQGINVLAMGMPRLRTGPSGTTVYLLGTDKLPMPNVGCCEEILQREKRHS